MSISATLSPAKSATTAFTPRTPAAPQHLPKLSPPKLLKYPKPSFSPYPNCCYTQGGRQPIQLKPPRASSSSSSSSSPSSDDNIAPKHRSIHGECFVVDDNIDTDQIIPAEYLTLVPSKPDEYEKLGSYAMCGLPARFGKFIAHGDTKTKYPIVIGGANFGCGSSREHAPVCLGAAGVKAIVAESYARIFFRNSVSTGAVYPLESEGRICLEFKTGHVVTVDLDDNSVVNHTTGRRYMLKPIGDARPVIDAGGIFNYARKAGMIATASP